MPTDPETYLRRLGERQVLDRDPQAYHRPGGGSLGEAARVLLTAGAVAPEVAERIVQDYEWALRLRDPDQRRMPAQHALRRSVRGGPRAHPPANPPAVQPLAPPRVVACRRTVDQPWGRVTLRSVSMESGTATIDVVIRWPGRTSGSHRGPGRFGPHGPPSHPGHVTVTDDRGKSVQAGFSGGGGEGEWTGQFRTPPPAHSPLAADTAYLEVLGERIELPPTATTSGVTLRLEPVEHGGPAAAALWGTLTNPFARHGFTDPEVAIDALVACGVLAPDDPAIGQVRAVVNALGFAHARVHRMSRPSSPPQPPPPVRLPEPWASLVARQNRPPSPGPTGLVPVAAATPVFDGMSVAVSVLTSDPDGFRISVVMVGGGNPLPAWDPDAPRVAWWARDDRGGVYLGEWNGSSADGHRVTGDIGFDLPLDPRASRLDLMPTGPSTRAVIEVPLTWQNNDDDPSGGSDG